MEKHIILKFIVILTIVLLIVGTGSSVPFQDQMKDNILEEKYQYDKIVSSNIIFSGNIIYVDDNNTGGPWDGSLDHPYRYLQDGVNASGNGDTVFVFNGTYSCRNFTMKRKSIQLLGENKNTTIFYGFITISNSHGFTISDFTFRPYPLNNGSWSECLDISSSSRFTITNNVFENIGDQITDAIWVATSSRWVISHNIFRGTDKGQDGWVSAWFVFNYLIEDNIFYQTHFYNEAIVVLATADGAIIRNTIIGNPQSLASKGISVSSSIFVNISDNFVSYAESGLTLGGLPFLERKLLIANNTIINCEIGMMCVGLEDSIITKNWVTGGYESIVLLTLSSRNLVYKNTLQHAYGDITAAIMIEDFCSFNRVIANQISNNSCGAALYLVVSPKKGNQVLNRFHLNNFEENNESAWDCYLSLWYKPKGLFRGEGNYWDDYTGVDANGDGIGDSPYIIPGWRSKDRFPLMEPVDINNVTECDAEVSRLSRILDRGATATDIAFITTIDRLLPHSYLKNQFRVISPMISITSTETINNDSYSSLI
jgi:nitrous oxidase accessory protein NosD